MLSVVWMAMAVAGGDVQGDCLGDAYPGGVDLSRHECVLAARGAKPLEQEAADGVELYRVFYIDGYSRSMPAIAFERRPQNPPRLVVHIDAGRRLEAAVPPEVWGSVQAAARFADRELAPLATTPLDGLEICLHPWTYTVEIANARRGGQVDADIRSRTASACAPGLAQEFAWTVARHALAVLPHCARLAPEHYRNDVARLAVCARLSGDVFAAADVMNGLGGPFFDLRPDRDERVSWGRLLGVGQDTRLTWGDGRQSIGYVDIGRFLDARVAEDESYRGHVESVHGVSAGRATVSGTLSRWEDREDDTLYFHAPFTQVWILSPYAHDWELESWTVGVFAPAQ